MASPHFCIKGSLRYSYGPGILCEESIILLVYSRHFEWVVGDHGGAPTRAHQKGRNIHAIVNAWKRKKRHKDVNF